MEKQIIMQVLVGSQAHGLAGPESDFDYRGVYVLPTQEILSLGYTYKGTHWVEGEKEDQTAYEIGHFLNLASKANPTILEMFVAPIHQSYYDVHEKIDGVGNIVRIAWTKELRELFPYVYNPKNAFDAFVGYGMNQRKKMLDNHLDRWHKYATAYLRTVYNLCDLLSTGKFSLKVENEMFKTILMRIREQDSRYSPGSIIDMAEKYISVAKVHLETAKNTQDLGRVNEFLLKTRKEFWR